MTASVLIVTHGAIGQTILDVATKIVGSVPMPIETMSIDMDDDYETHLSNLNKRADKLNSGDGVLILTDLFGATPSNIASATDMHNCIIVSGINLPMLLRVMNYYALPLFQLCDKAVDGGKDGVLAYYLDKNNATNTN